MKYLRSDPCLKYFKIGKNCEKVLIVAEPPILLTSYNSFRITPQAGEYTCSTSHESFYREVLTPIESVLMRFRITLLAEKSSSALRVILSIGADLYRISTDAFPDYSTRREE